MKPFLILTILVFGSVTGSPVDSRNARQDVVEEVLFVPDENLESLTEVGNLFNSILEGLQLLPVAAAHAIKQQRQNATISQNVTTIRPQDVVYPLKPEVAPPVPVKPEVPIPEGVVIPVTVKPQPPPPVRRVVQYLPVVSQQVAGINSPEIITETEVQPEDPDEEDEDANILKL